MKEEREGWDSIVDPIREIRMRISERFGHDPVRYGEHLMERQTQFKDRLVFTGDAGRDAEEPGKGKSAA